MSLAIDTDKVTHVLIEGNWHKVEGQSFDIDAYEFVEMHGSERFVVHGGGHGGITSSGFRFIESGGGGEIVGPLSAIQAVRLNKR